MKKSSVQEIKERFDHDVERFSELNTGQATTIDATVSLELLTEAAKRIKPDATNLLDIGCGAGNYTLKMLSKIPHLNCTLIDLSQAMLNRAQERVSPLTNTQVSCIQSDIRELKLSENKYDIILAGAVLHHLRDDNDWENSFRKLYALLKPGGCLMISDLIIQESDAITTYTWFRYGDYLEDLKDKAYRDLVFNYIEKEDTPRSMTYQLDLMKKVGFRTTDILHKNMCFGAFGGIK
ncbi:class I SAM-dependent methyltransferase [Labilibacter marinus]|uniref:class I SAM-dependent methyltransferase n=1 Tax=Labilibacter marinus TaxID=1477105 RepID=UPI0008342B54|nr:class I SAM-dependent methyltransferase [Labilibacter marinus]